MVASSAKQLLPRQSQADLAVLILWRQKGGALSHDDGSCRLGPSKVSSSGACSEMVSPADVPAILHFSGLACPAYAKAGSDSKSEFPELSNRLAMGAAR